MGLFDLFDEVLDSAEDVITETPRTMIEKGPEFASFVGNASLTAGQKVIEHIGREAAKRPGGEQLAAKCTELAEGIKKHRMYQEAKRMMNFEQA